MITIHHTTAYYVDEVIKMQNDFIDNDNLVLRDFQEVELAKWELIKLIETHKNVVIFVTIPDMTREKINKMNDIKKICTLLNKEITYNNFHFITKKTYQVKDYLFQDKVKNFDKVKFFEDNFNDFERLAYNFSGIIKDDKSKKQPPFNTENVFGETRYFIFSFVRQLISYLLYEHGGNYIPIGICMNKNRTTTMSGIETISNYINYNIKLSDLRTIEELSEKLKIQLGVSKQQTICK